MLAKSMLLLVLVLLFLGIGTNAIDWETMYYSYSSRLQTCTRGGLACMTSTTCPSGTTTTASRSFVGYPDSQKCDCFLQSMTCASVACADTSIAYAACKSVPNATVFSCALNCDRPETYVYAGLYVSFRWHIAYCGGSGGCNLNSCPSDGSGSSFLALSDTAKCTCMKQNIACLRAKCPSSYAVCQTVDAVKPGFPSLTCDVGCNSGSLVKPSYIIAMALLLLLSAVLV